MERHLEHRRDAAGSRAPRTRFPAFPLGATWVIKVDVGVYNTWQHYEPSSVHDLCAIAHLAPDGSDDSAGDRDIGRALSRGEDDGAAPDHEVGSGHTSSIVMSCAPSQSVSRPISGSCSWPCVRVAK